VLNPAMSNWLKTDNGTVAWSLTHDVQKNNTCQHICAHTNYQSCTTTNI